MWNNFEPIANDEETAINGFSKSGMFKITSDDEIKLAPTVKCITQNKRMILAVDTNLYLLSDENIVDSASCSLGCQIDDIAVSPCGDLVICLMSDGNVHGIHIKGVALFTLTIDSKDIGPEKTFIGIQFINQNYYIMCVSGMLYRLYNVEGCLSQSIINGDTSVNNTLYQNAGIEKVFNKSIYDLKVKSFTVISSQFNENQHLTTNNKNVDTVIASTHNYLLFQTLSTCQKLKLNTFIDDIKLILNLNHLVIGVTFNGNLVEIYPYTKLVMPIKNSNDYLIDDAIVMECTSTAIELLILTKPNESGNRFMKIIDYPSMKCNFELMVPNNSWLVNQSKLSDNMYYMSGDQFQTNIVQQLEMNIISETNPDQRFHKLISKGRLDEAEVFGTQFNLCLQPLYEAKAKRIISSMSKIDKNNSSLLQKSFNQLLDLAKLIKDASFFLALRNVEISDRNIMKQFLSFLVKNLNLKNHQKDLNDIEEQLLRFDTLEIIDPNDTNWQWQDFVFRPFLLNVVMDAFKNDINVACVIWRRHASYILTNLAETNIIQLFNSIPATTKPFNIIQWLKHFVPCILQIKPQEMSFLIDWSIQRTRSLQYSNHWPEVGLEFCNNIFTIFDDTNFLFSDATQKFEFNMEKLYSIITVLENLSVLKKDYNLTLTLDDYINDSIEETAFRILQRINLNNLSKMAENFLYPIFVEKGLSPVDVIIRYINFLVTNRKSISLWQERAVASTALLYNEEQKLQAAVLVLKSAAVPWSKALDPLVAYSSSNHPLAQQIYKEFNLQTIKIMKVKYGWPADSNAPLFKLACRIVKMNLPDLITDIKTLVETDSRNSSEINMYTSYELVRKGNIDQAIEFIKSLDDKQCQECCVKMLNIVSEIFNEQMSDDQNCANNLLEFLKHTTKYLSKENIKIVNELHRLQALKQHLNISISLHELRDNNMKYERLNECVLKVVEQLQFTITSSSSSIISKVWNNCLLLAKSFDLNDIFVIIQVLKELGNLQLSCEIAKFVLELKSFTSKDFDYYVKFAVLLISQEINATEIDFTYLSYPISYRLLCEASKYDHFEIRELLNWTRIINDLYSLELIENNMCSNAESDKKIRDSLFKQKTNDKSRRSNDYLSVFEQVAPTNGTIQKSYSNLEPAIRCVSLALKYICLANINCTELDALKDTLNDRQDNDHEDVNDFFASLERLIKIKQHSTAYKIIHYMLKIQRKADGSMMLIPEEFVHTFHKKILKYALAQKEPNFIDAFSVLMSDKNPEILLKFLSNELQNGQYKINFLLFQETFNMLTQNDSKTSETKKTRLDYFYFAELCKIDSSLKGRQTIQFTSIEDIFDKLKTKMLNVSLLDRMCKDYNWNFQEALVTQVIAILKMQELKFDIILDAFGKEEIAVKSSVDQMKALCQPYIEKITNLELLARNLLNFMDTINFYFYELYLCIIEILYSINMMPKDKEGWKNILLFLKHEKVTKRRRNVIGQIETDLCLKSEIGVLPKISKYRFPFKLIVQEPLKNILDDELCLDNYYRWFPLIKLHTEMNDVPNVSEINSLQDYFCMATVKNSKDEYRSNSEKEPEKWNLQPTNNAFLESIKQLITYMHDTPKILLILYFITNQAPEGADQVEAAYECLKFAIKHEKELMANQKSVDTVLKIKRKYPLYKTRHLLHLYMLDDDYLIELIENPTELIKALYTHQIILNPKKPDINKVAEEIAQLNEINFSQLQISLIEKWLSFGTKTDSCGMDETFYEDLNVSSIVEEDNTSGEFVSRAYYILNSWSKEKSMKFLINHITPDSHPCVNIDKQLQVFECFNKLINETDIEYFDFANKSQFIVLKCVYNLKQIGYNVAIDKFENYNKVEILQKVYRSHFTNQKGLEVMSYICIGYDIYLPVIWNGLLKQMVSLKMFKQLSSLVELLSTKKDLLRIDGLALAWEYVIKVPIKNANRTKSYEQDCILGKSLFLLQSCPFVYKFDLVDLAACCIRIERYNMAAVLIAFAKDEQKSKILKIIHQQDKKVSKNDIKELEEFGIYPFITKLVTKELETYSEMFSNLI